MRLLKKNNSKIKLISKAYNLDILKKIVSSKKAQIPDYIYFKKKKYFSDKNNTINLIIKKFKNKKIILRSSALNEDKHNLSNAGKYHSQIFSKKLKKYDLKNELDNFVKQFKKKDDEIIIQEYIEKVDLSGVIFTKDLNHNGPYFQINYDTSGKTNLVTSGSKNKLQKNLIIFNNYKPKRFKKLIELIKIIQSRLHLDRLDIEFCFKNKNIYLFQVRKLPKNIKLKSQKKISLKHFSKSLTNIEKKIIKFKLKNPTLAGKDTIFSNMADWNPAEMIGNKPSNLALSLYQEIITDNIWSKQRVQYGYKDVSPNVLMYNFGGSPYIDLRTDINSFLPIGINSKYEKIIINKYIDIIKKKKSLHDKIEFELIETCFSFLTKKRLKEQFKEELINHYIKALKLQTKKIITGKFIDIENERIKNFQRELNKIKKAKISPIQKNFFIVNLIKSIGSLPFAGFARCAFISKRILNDLKLLKLIKETEYNDFFGSLKTITDQLSEDNKKLFKKKITKKNFLDKYGHLRPSTYDIGYENYHEGFNRYFSNFNKKKIKQVNKPKFKNLSKINKIFKNELGINFKIFLEFARVSFVKREEAKFIFTKGIDEIFKNLIKFGEKNNIKRNDLGFLNIKELINYYSNVESKKLITSLNQTIKKNKLEFNLLKLIKLPDVIVDKNDIYEFEENIGLGNYVTSQICTGEIIKLNNSIKQNLNDKIILIESADPGYDYIFNYNIKGLITRYGGANSHMTIRCMELNIPAIIGIGKFNFEKLLNSKFISFDCKNKKFWA